MRMGKEVSERKQWLTLPFDRDQWRQAKNQHKNQFWYMQLCMYGDFSKRMASKREKNCTRLKRKKQQFVSCVCDRPICPSVNIAHRRIWMWLCVCMTLCVYACAWQLQILAGLLCIDVYVWKLPEHRKHYTVIISNFTVSHHMHIQTYFPFSLSLSHSVWRYPSTGKFIRSNSHRSLQQQPNRGCEMLCQAAFKIAFTVNNQLGSLKWIRWIH